MVSMKSNDNKSLIEKSENSFQNAENKVNDDLFDCIDRENIFKEDESEAKLSGISFHRDKYNFEKSIHSSNNRIENIEKNKHSDLKDYIFHTVTLFMTMIRSYLTVAVNFLCQFFHNYCKANNKLVRAIGLLVIIILVFVQSRGNVGQHAFETQRLFSSYPYVTDYFYGELSMLKEVINQADISCILYYAPWDRQSQNVVPHFLKVAAYHHEQVTFAAINCWLSDSECRSTYRLTQYPIIALHIRVSNFDHVFTILYDGPLDSHHLIKFISNAYRPIIHVSSRAELLALKLEYQAVVIGFYDDLSSTEEYLQFYYSSLSKLEYEHMNSVAFALITNPKLAESLYFTTAPGIHLELYNTTIRYPHHLPANQKNITDFIEMHLSQIAKWLHINGHKNSVLNTVLKRGPILVLFAPDNPYLSSNDPFRVLHSISMEYFNCYNSTLLQWFSDNIKMVSRSRLRESDQHCRKYLKEHQLNEDNLHQSLYPPNERNEDTSFCSQSPVFDQDESPQFSEDFNYISQISWDSLLTYIDSTAMSIKNFCNSADSLKTSCSTSTCKNKTETKDSMARENYMPNLDPKHNSERRPPYEDETIMRMTDWLSEEHCKKLVLGSALDHAPVLKDEERTVSLGGLGCKMNRSLNFVAIDSLIHDDIATELGLNLHLNVPPKTGALIIDQELEEIYTFNDPLSRNNLASFILNYTNGFLRRSKKTNGINTSKQFCHEGMKCIADINAINYLNVTQTPGTTYVVLHYAANCGACSALSHILLMAKHATSELKNLEFVRIDITKNTLPWHLTFEHVPTLIVYPADRKSESRILDTSNQLSLQSLLLFVSYGLSEDQRQLMALVLCDVNCRSVVSRRAILRTRKLRRDINNSKAQYYRYVIYLSKLDKSRLENVDRYRIIFYLKSIIHKKIQLFRKLLTRSRSLLENAASIPLLTF